MGAFIQLSGRRFHRLTALRVHHRAGPGRYFWSCRCDCGNRAIVAGMHLRSGNTTSCGCRKMETRIELPRRTTTHGLSTRRIYRTFKGMHATCSNRNHKDYRLYGGRGVRVCARWSGRRGLARFVSDMGEPPDGLSIDRINPNGDYEPRNCRWATNGEQANNKRNTRWITWRGQRRTLSQWAAGVGRSAAWLHKRLKRMSMARAMKGA